MTQVNLREFENGVNLIECDEYMDGIHFTLAKITQDSELGQTLIVIDNDDYQNVDDAMVDFSGNKSRVTTFVNVDKLNDMTIIDKLKITSPISIFHINYIEKALPLDSLRLMEVKSKTYYLAHKDNYYGDVIFDDLDIKSDNITDAQLILSRVHGQFISLIYNGDWLIISDYDKLKDFLNKNNLSHALNGYKRRNPSTSFMYWDIEQCISLIKTMSDNLKINM